MATQLRATVHELVQKGKGILAAVESSPTIAKRFSYGRALQDPAMQAWWGQPANAQLAQKALLQRARLNSAATLGEYSAPPQACSPAM